MMQSPQEEQSEPLLAEYTQDEVRAAVATRERHQSCLNGLCFEL